MWCWFLVVVTKFVVFVWRAPIETRFTRVHRKSGDGSAADQTCYNCGLEHVANQQLARETSLCESALASLSNVHVGLFEPFGYTVSWFAGKNLKHFSVVHGRVQLERGITHSPFNVKLFQFDGDKRVHHTAHLSDGSSL